MGQRALSGFLLAGLLAGCSAGSSEGSGTASVSAVASAPSAARPQTADVAPERSRLAALPDRGELLAYDRVASPMRGADRLWHPVRISEAHARRALSEGGTLVLHAPDGSPIRLVPSRRVRGPDGNWTFVGEALDGQPGTEAVITFGQRAIFGSIPTRDGILRLTTAGGRVWMGEARHPRGVARGNAEPDFLVPPRLPFAAAAGSAPIASPTASAAPVAGAAAAATASIDVLFGYTPAFAQRFGGQSGALTRLTYLTEVANQSYVSSQVDGRVRLVHAMQVTYADATNNKTTLEELSGYRNGAEIVIPAELQKLHTAREQYGADLVSLVRNFHVENDGCGVAWVLGAGQTSIDNRYAPFGMSVVSDSNGIYYPDAYPDEGSVCDDETFAHEAGHNLGLAHDRDTADGADNVLQANEYGAFSFSFGYRSAPGNFVTVMAYRATGEEQMLRLFSNPNLTCVSGIACGVVNEADNARALRITMPIIAGFRATVVPLEGALPGDYNGDEVSDVLWRNNATGRNSIWKSASSASQQAVTAVTNLAWKVVGSGDFDADGRADILWRNTSTGGNVIWRGGSSLEQQAVASTPDTDWRVVAVGDFDGDSHSDIFWRHARTGTNVVWKRGASSSGLPVASVPDQAWRVVGAADFNADGRDDVVWRNVRTGANTIWLSANSNTRKTVTSVTDVGWEIVGVGDFNGDGLADLLWRHATLGRNTIWRTARASTQQAVATLSTVWKVEGTGDYNGDGTSDILWRSHASGTNSIWLGGRSTTRKAMSAVSSLAWEIVP